MNTSEILNRAADLIEERGWKRGDGWNESPDSKLCLEGGIMAAMGVGFGASVVEDLPFGGLWACPAYRAVAEYLGRDVTLVNRTTTFGEMLHRAPVEPLWQWNDDQKEAARVIETLRAAAVIQEARENATVEVTA